VFIRSYPSLENVYASEEYKKIEAKNLTLQALGNPENIIAMESHPYETTIFNAVANSVLSVQDLMRAGACTLADADTKLNETVVSAQAALDMLYEAEEM